MFGIPYYGMAEPFLDEGNVQGCVPAILTALTSRKSVVTLKVNEGWIPVPFSKIIYVEARDQQTYVYVQKYMGTHKYTLNEFDYVLPKEEFVCCHRSFMVNVTQIQEIYPDKHSTFLL
ncbi:MAG: hypothetical protein PME_27320 [Priestia megaterium]